MGRQSAFTTPIGLPEAPVQLLQLWAQWHVAGQVHAEGFQPLLQLQEGGPEVTSGREGDSGFWFCWGLANPRAAPCRVPPHSPLLRVQIAAAHGNGEEAWGTVWGAVAVQEASNIEAKVHGAGQVIRVGVHPPDDLSNTRVSTYPRPLGWELPR